MVRYRVRHVPVLQACTLARRNAEVFLKYIHRNNVSMPGAASHARGPEQQVKGQCRPKTSKDKSVYKQ